MKMKLLRYQKGLSKTRGYKGFLDSLLRVQHFKLNVFTFPKSLISYKQ